ncbi:MAG TPA: ABC transporter substrate-binding protein, partial [Phormidium sp.]
MKTSTSASGLKLRTKLSLGLIPLLAGFLAAACQTTTTNTANTTTPTPTAQNAAATPTAAPAATGKGLRIGSLLPSTGDLASIGQPMIASVPLLVETVNKCGGVNGQPVSLVSEDDQTKPEAGAAAMTKLAEVDKVAGVVGSFASSVSSAAVDIAVRNKVMLVSPGSTSPVFTDRAKKGDFQG